MRAIGGFWLGGPNANLAHVTFLAADNHEVTDPDGTFRQ